MRLPSGPLFAALALGALATLGLPGIDPASAATRTEIKRLVVEESLATRVPPSLAMAVAKIESDFQDNALSPAGARGVMQIMPATGRDVFGVEPDELWDPRLNIEIGVGYLEDLIDRYGGRWDLALSHYYSGRVSGKLPAAEPHPIARKYVASVLRWQRRYAEQSHVWARMATTPPPIRAAAARPEPAPRPVVQETIRVEWTAPAAVVREPPRAARNATGAARDATGDDFDDDIEERRRRARPLLDDFTPMVHDG